MKNKRRQLTLFLVGLLMVAAMPVTAVSQESDRPENDDPPTRTSEDTTADQQGDGATTDSTTVDDFIRVTNPDGSGDAEVRLDGSAGDGSTQWDIENDATAGNQLQFLHGFGTPQMTLTPGGFLGLGTTSPQDDLHIANTGNDHLLLEDTDGASFNIEVGGDFFDIDSTDFPLNNFRIHRNAPSNALVVTDGIGIGTSNPDSSLHVRGGAGDTELKVEETSGTVAKRFLMRLENPGSPGFAIRNTDSGEEWRYAMNANDGFVVSRAGTGGAEMLIAKNGAMFLGQPSVFRLSADGNLSIDGTLSEGSDQAMKQDIQAVDPAALLARLRGLPISTWAYTHTPGATHLGPMAQDFHSVFGIGDDPTRVSPRDMASVALATIQELDAQLQAKDAQIASLEEQLEQLRSENEAKDARFADIEERLERLEGGGANE